MAGLPKFLYSDRTESEVALIARAGADGERARMNLLTNEVESNGIEGEFGAAVTRGQLNGYAFGTTETTLKKSTVNSGKMTFRYEKISPATFYFLCN